MPRLLYSSVYPMGNWNKICSVYYLTHWGWDKMAAIFQTTFSYAFSGTKTYGFRFKIYCSLFLRVQLTIFQHWFRSWLGAEYLKRQTIIWTDYVWITDAYMRHWSSVGLRPRWFTTNYSVNDIYLHSISSPFVIWAMTSVIKPRIYTVLYATQGRFLILLRYGCFKMMSICLNHATEINEVDTQSHYEVIST